MSELELNNSKDKYVVCVKKTRHELDISYLKNKNKFANTVFYFRKADELSYCKIVATRKALNLVNVDSS